MRKYSRIEERGGSSVVSHRRGVRVGLKVDQIGPKSNKPGLFQKRFQYILARFENILKSDLKKTPGFIPLGANLIDFEAKSAILDVPARYLDYVNGVNEFFS